MRNYDEIIDPKDVVTKDYFNGETLVPNFTDKYIALPNISDPGSANSGTIRIYSKSVSGRSMLKWVGQTGLDNIAQPMVAFNKVAWWNPPGNSTTLPVNDLANGVYFVKIEQRKNSVTKKFIKE